MIYFTLRETSWVEYSLIDINFEFFALFDNYQLIFFKKEFPGVFTCTT